MILYQFNPILSRQEYVYIAFNNVFTGFKSDYADMADFLSCKEHANQSFVSGVIKVNHSQFLKSINLSQSEMLQYFKSWSKANSFKPKKKVS